MADLTLATPSTPVSPVASDDGDMQAQAHSHDVIPLREVARAWFAISPQTFGGPAGQIAVMQRTLVDEKRWIGQQRFLFALSYWTLPGRVLPGEMVRCLAALFVTWAAFVPCFLFTLLGAPYVERLRGNRSLATALAGITAAVVGVTALGLALVFWRRWSVLRTLGACALAGIVVGLAGAI